MDYGIIGGADGPTAILVAGRVGGWNWINWFGVFTVILILIPNIIYAVKCRGVKNLCTNKLLNILEQIGRYGSMLFLCVYVGVNDDFAFSSVFGFLTYGFGNICLILSYWCTWAAYFRVVGVWKNRGLAGKKGNAECRDKNGESSGNGVSATFVAGEEQVGKIVGLKYTLAILPAVLFFLDGLTLWHIPLMLCAVIFAIGHIGVTRENIRKSIQVGERSTSNDF